MYFYIAEPFHEIQISLDIVKKKSTILLDKPNKNDKLDILLALWVHPIFWLDGRFILFLSYGHMRKKERIVFWGYNNHEQ